MTNPIVHSAISIRIVLAFLEFLSCVQSSVGADKERIENLKESLIDIFKISPSMIEEIIPNVSLFNLFNSESHKEDEQNAEPSNMPSSFSIGSATQITLEMVSLFHEFHMAVTAVGFFDSSIGESYTQRRSHAKQIFKAAIGVLTRAGHQTFDNKWNLADALKILGNIAMRNRCYGKAIEMYSCALALWNSAIYFCNRAAAFAKVGRLDRAILDCYEAIKVEPGCVLAHYRLGCAYYEQGKNFEAIREGFIKALQLDPHNESALGSLQLAESKMRDELAWVSDQTESLRRNGVIPMTDSTRTAARQSTVLVFRGPEEGGNGPWELVEDMGGAIPAGDNGDDDDGDTVSVADNFIDVNGRNTPPR